MIYDYEIEMVVLLNLSCKIYFCRRLLGKNYIQLYSTTSTEERILRENVVYSR